MSHSFNETVDQLATHVSACCHVNQVFGAPVRVGDALVIPVAQLLGGFGAGAGAGAGTEPQQAGHGGGMGGGAGFVVNPCGVFVVSERGAHFHHSQAGDGLLRALRERGRNLLRRWLRR